MKLTVILSPGEDSGYTALCPALPGAVSEGESLEEALTNVKEAGGGLDRVMVGGGQPDAHGDAGDGPG